MHYLWMTFDFTSVTGRLAVVDSQPPLGAQYDNDNTIAVAVVLG